ncbi:MAG: winged helix-turn-helix transcriptional regulator [Vitreoscilla sp.]|nr:winged helix-turn-helix transcriptional regulator [Vitreoscilla sp.]
MPALERLQMPGVFVAIRGSQEQPQVVSPKRVLLQFRVIANAVRSTARPVGALHPVTDRKLLALNAIAHAPGIGVNALAKELGMRQPTASQVVKALAGLHLVEVQRDDGDRRAVSIRPSVAGLAVLHGLPAHFEFGDRLPEALARLDGDSLRSLESGLADLVQALGRTAPILGSDDDDNSHT